MRSLLLPLFALSAAACAPASDSSAQASGGPPAKLGLCTACHGSDGMSRTPGTPHIAAQDETYLRESLGQYRRGERKPGPMTAVAGTLSQSDIDELAAWYARLPFGGAK